MAKILDQSIFEESVDAVKDVLDSIKEEARRSGSLERRTQCSDCRRLLTVLHARLLEMEKLISSVEIVTENLALLGSGSLSLR